MLPHRSHSDELRPNERLRRFVVTLRGTSSPEARVRDHDRAGRRRPGRLRPRLHQRAFRRLGGTVRVIVLDNLKEGILTPDIYDPRSIRVGQRTPEIGIRRAPGAEGRDIVKLVLPQR
jgi:hypothetical protein